MAIALISVIIYMPHDRTQLFVCNGEIFFDLQGNENTDPTKTEMESVSY